MGLAGRLLLATLVIGAAFRAMDAQAPALTFEQKEQFLRAAHIISERPSGERITGTKRLTLTDGVLTHDAHLQQIDVFKPVYRAKDFVETNFRDSYKFNIPAYRVAKMPGLENTPPCVYREVNGKGSSMCWWINDVQFDEARRDKRIEPPDPNSWSRELNEIRVFDQLIDDVDRTQENLLINKNWTLWMIDHSRSFRITYRLRKPENLQRISQSLLNATKKLCELRAAAATEPYITRDEVHAMMVRRDLLVTFFAKEISENGKTRFLPICLEKRQMW